MGEKHQLVASRTPPTRGLAHSPGRRPDWESNPRPFGLQNDAQPTEPHQSWLLHFYVCCRDGIFHPHASFAVALNYSPCFIV